MCIRSLYTTTQLWCRFDQYADAWDTSVTLSVDGQEVRFFHCVDRYGVNRVWVDHNSFLSKVCLLPGLAAADSANPLPRGSTYADSH